MGVKILHGWKIGLEKGGGGAIFYIQLLKVGVKILHRLKKGGQKGRAYPLPQT